MGGAMNLLTIGFIERITGHEYVYSSWVVNMFPILMACTLATSLYLISFKYEQKSLPGTKEYFAEEFRKLPPMSIAEKVCLWLFLTANALAFFRPLYDTLLPTLVPAYAFLLCGFLTFVLPAGAEGKRISTWEYACPKLMWGLYYLFAGGLALGELLSVTGAGAAVADMIAGFNVNGSFGLVVIFTVFASFLGNITSNTAAVAITLPIVVQITQGFGLNPIPFLYITSVACNQAYILPTSVRAIPVGYGLDPADMVWPGWVVVLLNCAITIGLGYLFLLYWPRFSLA
jgi:sodium-dependent dicarboxylate transporter 2/3/5